MKRSLVLFAAALSMLVARGEELKMAQVPAQAHWFAHVDVARLLTSQVGTRLLDEIKADARMVAQLDAVLNNVGVDLRKDVRSVTLFGPDASKNHGVMVLSGTFATDKLLAAITANPEHEEGAVGNATGHKWVDNGRTHYGCFLPGGVCVFSDYQEAARVTVEVMQSGQGGLTPDGVLGGLAKGPEGYILLAAADVRGGVGDGGRPQMTVLRNAESLQLQITEKNGLVQVELALVAGTPEVAQRIAEIGRGLLAFGQLSEESDPVTAKLAQAARVNQDGKQVKIVLSCPVDDLIQWLKAHRGQQKEQKTSTAPAGAGSL